MVSSGTFDRDDRRVESLRLVFACIVLFPYAFQTSRSCFARLARPYRHALSRLYTINLSKRSNNLLTEFDTAVAQRLKGGLRQETFL